MPTTSHGDDTNDNGEFPLVRCIKCGRAMFLIAASAVDFGQERLTYRCPECATDTVRLFGHPNRETDP